MCASFPQKGAVLVHVWSIQTLKDLNKQRSAVNLNNLREGRPLGDYTGASVIKTRPPVGPYSRPMTRFLRWSWGRWRFIMNEVPLLDGFVGAGGGSRGQSFVNSMRP